MHTCVYDYEWIFINVYVCIHVYMHGFVFVCECVCIYFHACTRIDVCFFNEFMYVHLHMCTYVCVHKHINVCMHAELKQSGSSIFKVVLVYMCTYTRTVNQMQGIFLEIGSDYTAYATEADLMECFGAIVGIKITAARGDSRGDDLLPNFAVEFRFFGILSSLQSAQYHDVIKVKGRVCIFTGTHAE